MSFDLFTPYNCNVCFVLKILQQYDEEYLPSNKTYTEYLVCRGCLMVRYCSVQHQEIDWILHQEFCEAVQEIKKRFGVYCPLPTCDAPQSIEDLEEAIIKFKYMLKVVLDRSLNSYEEELSSFFPFCRHCFKCTDLNVVCMKCKSQAYCTEEHRELHKDKHDEVCELLQIYYCPYKVIAIKIELSVEFGNRIQNMPNMNLVQCIEEVFSLKVSAKPYESVKDYQTFSWAADFSCIMTICYALEVLNFKNNVEEMNIFILGATSEANSWFLEIHCKLFFLQYPRIQKVVLNFIGPEVVEPCCEQLEFSFLGLTRSVKFEIYKGLYQDYCKDRDLQPSLIVAFNCGFSEFSRYKNRLPTLNLDDIESLTVTDENDTWHQGLKYMARSVKVPIVFTSFTEQESQFDFGAFQYAISSPSLNFKINRMINIIKNPFHDLRPFRQWYPCDEEEFYYRNGYIQIISSSLRL